MSATAQRARQIAEAAAGFADLLGEVTEEKLLAYVAAELGHAGSLDAFQRHGAQFARAIAPRTILHVISANTPHAGLQSLLRGLLLGSHNLCKLPAGGLPALTAFCQALPAGLAQQVELSERLPEDWLDRADAMVVFGSDATLAEFRNRARPGQQFIGHGHRVSLGLILDDPGLCSLPEAARAVSLFDQRGCLSPHLLYVREPPAARAYAAGLAAEMARFAERHPPPPVTKAEAAGVHLLREDWRFRAANDPARYGLWQSADSIAWTVLYDGAETAFTPSPLNRTVFVKPLPPDLAAALAGVREHVSAIGLWPATHAWAEWVASLDTGASRICPLGALQLPPLTWHQDGGATLASLVRWVDFEPD
jgi:hypothetical protein